MKFCPACGRGNPPEAVSCERCGAPVDEVEAGQAPSGVEPPSGEGETLAPGTQLGEGRYEILSLLG
ncbi:MAG: zinc-ribbon domain-containing protein, partial [Myxococcota bacterium]|nr:zinc-ribbon domain-containing protein [Myxococcota bacterium]